MRATKYDELFKIVICGDSGVGKKTLLTHFTKENYKLTIGVDFLIKTIDIQTLEGIKRCRLQVLHIGGRDPYSLVPPIYRGVYSIGVLGALLVFDLTNNESFEHLPNWIEKIKSNSKGDIPILLIGNKCDLINERVVSYSDIEDLTKKYNLNYMETNAKSGEKASDCFVVLTYLMMRIEVPDELFGKNGLKHTPRNGVLRK